MPIPLKLAIRGAASLALALSLLGLQACSLQAPKPWEKGMLAKPEMTLSGDPLDQRFSDHISSSKQAATGGYGVGGGGCGCN